MTFGNKTEKPEEQMDWKKSVVLYLHDVIYLLTVILIVFLLIFRVIVVSGSSMRSTLVDGDYLLLFGNLLYGDPEYGDIVVISKESFDDGKPLIKRVIAAQGQIVDIDFDSGIVFVDGQALDEPYINTPTNLPEGVSFPLLVEDNCYFVMGDNRNNSRDSRSPEIGQIDRREILGKAFFLMNQANCLCAKQITDLSLKMPIQKKNLRWML